MLSLRKLHRIACLAFNNAIRLHNDAILLYKNKSYPSAYYFSILSQEEIGKMHLINNFVLSAKEYGQIEEFEDEWLELLYKHPVKQYAFFRNSPVDDHSSEGLVIAEKMLKGALEAKKQESVYVGLRKIKKKVEKKGKIKHPHHVTKKIAKEHITKINDYLIVTGIGVRHGQFSLDNEIVEEILKKKKFIEKNYSNWPYISNASKTTIRRLQKFFADKIIPT